MGHLDEAGYLYITDRKKDVIITGGLNVYPAEVEQVLWSHPGVADCAVVGIPDDDWGERVVAVIETTDGQPIDNAEVLAWCRSELGAVKTPKELFQVDSLPRSPNGKVMRREAALLFRETQRRQ
ncbi:class I adenylate-forming enzyme family protein [Thermocatellispora tengchongensis]|uniref:class I adenylate-forming enzyme family protein n=1 Tax=Thermocatellispora tengchongensis TaxID=1073253 RepID=UPI00363188B0